MEQLFNLFYETSGLTTDSRNIFENSIFICLKGEKFDGNTFANEALLKGAKYVISDNYENCDNIKIFYVENTLTFLQKLANYHRRKFNIPIIGITGSNGKTTSKELISFVLATKYNILFTEGNLNNHIGVPLTLLRLNASHQIAVIEMGANKLNDIEELCNITEPTHGIITNIGKAHLEGFKNFTGVLNTKKELFDSVSKSNGTIIYNNDDENIINILPKETTNISYGTTTNATIKGDLTSLNPYIEMEWKFDSYISPKIQTNLVGKYNFYNFLAAITFGIQFNINPEEINKALSGYIPTNNRSQVKETANNTLILDCYNANPSSMFNAIESFSLIENKDKVAILGDMLELGDESVLEHQKIINQINSLQINTFYVGPIFKKILNTSNCFENRELAIEYFKNNPLNNMLILLKGSRGIGLEKLDDFF
ncbi:MAG: UDP-N-acetylmuramoyl-tripeptide--D-alanyl-D-alanine ligase [Flavobacteriia bacterium]|nr:UDP-N-acetylmuramoyl-tripeptide--D-alanyl-D-alanine ligase [Flavobacteriia bacterium]